MTIRLSERLQVISDYIEIGKSMADIGTDHGFLPIYLWENKQCPKVVLSDIGQGPLEKAAENLERLYEMNISQEMNEFFSLHKKEKGNIKECASFQPSEEAFSNFHMRKGDGLSTLEQGEVDVVVIAGMGGKLIMDILAENLEKSKSYAKYVLQPRNAPEKLKGWLYDHGFIVEDETLVREGKYIWEIIVTRPIVDERINFRLEKPSRHDLEISPRLFEKKDPLLIPFIEKKIQIEEKICGQLCNSKSQSTKIEETKKRKLELTQKLEKAQGVLR